MAEFENKKRGIIIADDDFSIRSLLGQIISRNFPYLEKEFYKSGEELEERLKHPPGHASVVLTDNDMKQGRDGLELIDSYSQGQWNKVPMILYTGKKDFVSENSLENVFCCLEKPSKNSELCSVVEKALDYYDKVNSFE